MCWHSLLRKQIRSEYPIPADCSTESDTSDQENVIKMNQSVDFFKGT
jgi:hypothetical protein